MSTRQEFRPDWASAPGDTICDILEERSISLSEFGRLIGRTPERTKELLQGRAAITIALARQLERALGGSVEFWMSRDFQFRSDVAKLRKAEINWISELPVGDMIRFGWLKPAPHPSEEVAACLGFFGVPSVRAWYKAYAELQKAIAFRTSPSLDSRPAAVAAWFRQGEIEATAIKCGPWDARRFQESLSEIRPLTRKKNPNQFVPALQNCCAQSGVAVAIVRAPSGCRASGATRFLSEEKALLLLSFRFLTDDHFWFTFFHEAGHLLLHGKRAIFLEVSDQRSDVKEREANDFAARILVPREFQGTLLKLGPNGREVIRFARRVGVSPGIIVGQLQHFGRVRHNQLNGLKRRFTWEE